MMARKPRWLLESVIAAGIGQRSWRFACADGRMMQVWEVPTENTFRLAAAGEGHVLTLLPDRCNT